MIPMANHLWQSTLFAAVAGLLTLALRRNRAALRYWIWLAASVKLLIPLSILLAIGSGIEPRAMPMRAVVPVAMEEITHPFTVVASPMMPASPAANPWPAILLSLWICGFLAVSFSWWRKYGQVRTAMRAGTRLPLELGIPVISSPCSLEPGVFGIFRPVLLLPDSILARLTRAQLDAITAHELAHVRRRDNLTAAIHMLVEAIFWFHPMVWWIEHRLMAERERACDEEVLQLGSEPRVYAEGILKVCECYLESPVAFVAGVTGANLKRRIRSIMTQRAVLQLDWGRKVLLASAGIAVIVGPILMGLAHAQSKAGSSVQFEVASVKPSAAGGGDAGMKSVSGRKGGLSFQIEHGRVTMPELNLYALIVLAYGLRGCPPFGVVRGCILLAGGPDWLRKDLFDLLAKMPEGSPNYTLTLPQLQSGQGPQLELMLQALLADRFRLKVHTEKKVAPVYALIVGKKGPKLKKAEGTEEGKVFFRGSTGPDSRQMITLTGKNSTMQDLVDLYMKFMDRPVVDQTGLKERFDFTMDYEANTDEPEPMRDLVGPALFKALEDRLGLKLEATKAPVGILVIDHAEKPSGN